MDKKKIIVVATIALVVLTVVLAILFGISPELILPYVLDSGLSDVLIPQDPSPDTTHAPSASEAGMDASFSATDFLLI